MDSMQKEQREVCASLRYHNTVTIKIIVSWSTTAMATAAATATEATTERATVAVAAIEMDSKLQAFKYYRV